MNVPPLEESERSDEAKLDGFFQVRPPGLRKHLAKVRRVLQKRKFGIRECWKWRTAYYCAQSDLCYVIVKNEEVHVGFARGTAVEFRALKAGIELLNQGQKQVRHFVLDGTAENLKLFERVVALALEVDAEEQGSAWLGIREKKPAKRKTRR